MLFSSRDFYCVWKSSSRDMLGFTALETWMLEVTTVLIGFTIYIRCAFIYYPSQPAHKEPCLSQVTWLGGGNVPVETNEKLILSGKLVVRAWCESEANHWKSCCEAEQKWLGALLRWLLGTGESTLRNVLAVFDIYLEKLKMIRQKSSRSVCLAISLPVMGWEAAKKGRRETPRRGCR